MTEPNQFPWKSQQDFVPTYDQLLPGDLWEGDVINEHVMSGLIAKVDQVAQVTKIVIASNVQTDDVGVYIDGALLAVEAGASEGATALALQNLLESSGLAAKVIASVTLNTATLTVTFADYEAHSVVEFSPDTTTATVTLERAAVSYEKLRFGYGVCRKATGSSANTIKIGKPTSATDMFAGVLIRTPDRGLSADVMRALDPDVDPDYLMPGVAYVVATKSLSPVVEYVGTPPDTTHPVYLIYTGPHAGKYRIDSGAASQVTRGDVEFNGTDAVGLIVDSLPTLSVASTTSDDATATALRDAWNASAQHFAVAEASVDLSGAESYIILKFRDNAAHTVTAHSPATADVSGITNLESAAAPTAVLLPNASWGRPSTTTGEFPCAYLRLNNP